MKYLSPHTAAIFESVTLFECIKSYTLVGGTALSLQLGARQSEDLDFMSWRKNRLEKREVDWPGIKKELETIGEVSSVDILGLDHVEFVLEGVKISFYANPNYSPLQSEITYMNNLRLADMISIGAMKMEVLMRRSNFRDYYYIYSLIESGKDIYEMMDMALKYSGHRLKSKNLVAMLTRSDRFREDANLKNMNPIYSVTPLDIEQRIIKELSREREK